MVLAGWSDAAEASTRAVLMDRIYEWLVEVVVERWKCRVGFADGVGVEGRERRGDGQAMFGFTSRGDKKSVLICPNYLFSGSTS